MNKVLGAVIIIIVLLTGVELHSLAVLRRKVSQLREDYDKAMRIAAKSSLLKQQAAELGREEKMLEERIPFGRSDPLQLSRQVSALAMKLGFSHLSFESVPSASAAALPVRGGAKIKVSSAVLLAKTGLRMKAECDYVQLLKFLDEINSISRLVVVKEVEIKRKEALLPRQEVVLRLEAYSFGG